MNTLVPRLLVVAVLLVAASACRTARPPAVVSPAEQAATEAALTALMTESAAAWNRADLAGHVAMYTDDAAFMTGRGPVSGRDTIGDILARGFWQDGRPVQQLRFEELAVRPLGPDHALLTGRFVLTGGDRPEASGRFSTIWTRTPDGWRIVYDHSS